MQDNDLANALVLHEKLLPIWNVIRVYSSEFVSVSEHKDLSRLLWICAIIGGLLQAPNKVAGRDPERKVPLRQRSALD